MAQLLQAKQKYRKRADEPALNVLRRHAETARDIPLSRFLNDLRLFQSGIDDAIVKGQARGYVEMLIGKGLEKVSRNYRKALSEERAKAEAVIAEKRDAWHELRRMTTGDSRTATLALLNFEATKARYAGKSSVELRADVDDYAKHPSKESGELDVLSMELLRRGLDAEHSLLRRLMKDNRSDAPWFQDVEAKAAEAKIRMIDGIPDGMVRVRVGEDEKATMGWEIEDLISVNFDLSAKKWDDDSQGEAS